jgi:hypothetical protein
MQSQSIKGLFKVENMEKVGMLSMMGKNMMESGLKIISKEKVFGIITTVLKEDALVIWTY